jgi:hypothetical protein
VSQQALEMHGVRVNARRSSQTTTSIKVHSDVLNRCRVVAAFLSLGTAVEGICVTQQAFLATGSATEMRSRVFLASSICEPLRELVEKLPRSHPRVSIESLASCLYSAASTGTHLCDVLHLTVSQLYEASGH